MAKKMTAAAVLLVRLLTLMGCGEKYDPKYVGKWEATGITVNGETTDNFVGVPLAALFRFELSDKGVVTWRSAVDHQVIQNANSDTDIRWKETGENTIQITVKDLNKKNPDETMVLYYRNNDLIIEENGSSIGLRKVDEFTEIDPDVLNSAASAIQNFGITG